MTGESDLLVAWGIWLKATGSADKTVTTRLAAIRALMAHQSLVDPAVVTAGQLAHWLADCTAA